MCDSGSYDAAVSKAGARAPCILRDRCGGDARGRFVRPMLISDMSTVRLMVVDGRAWTGKGFFFLDRSSLFGGFRDVTILHLFAYETTVSPYHLRVSLITDLVVDVGNSTPAMPSSTRNVFMISKPSTSRSPESVSARRYRRLTRAA